MTCAGCGKRFPIEEASGPIAGAVRTSQGEAALSLALHRLPDAAP